MNTAFHRHEEGRSHEAQWSLFGVQRRLPLMSLEKGRARTPCPGRFHQFHNLQGDCS